MDSTSDHENTTHELQAAADCLMSHDDYRAAYERAEIRVDFDRALAYRYVSARLLLPLVRLALMGAGLALAMTVHWLPGLLLIVSGFIIPRLTWLSAPKYMMGRSLADRAVYEDLSRLGILKVVRLRD